MRCVGMLLATSLAVWSVASWSSAETRNKTSEGVTLSNLQTAFYAESSASLQYEAYAARADSEGYGQLASLFRAVARGEGIHASNCAALIEEIGASPRVVDEPLLVYSTAENLAAASEEQKYESDVMYPEYIKAATQEGNEAAASLFDRNMKAEPMHQLLFDQALSDLAAYRGENVTFHVCAACGYVTRTDHSSKCDVCGAPKEKFIEVK